MGFLDKFKKPKWKHNDKNVRIDAVKELDDPDILVNMAKNDESSDVRKEAVSKISDETILIDLAKNDESWNVRSEAVSKISDEKILIDIAKNDYDEDVRKKAINKISDSKVLLNILKNEKSTRIRKDIIKYNINDKEILKKIAIEDEFLSNRYYARNNVTLDSETVIEINRILEEKYEKLDFKKFEGEPPTNKILVDLLNANLSYDVTGEDYAKSFKEYYQSGDYISTVKLLLEWNKKPDGNCLLAYFIFFVLEVESGVIRDLNLLEHVYERGLNYSGGYSNYNVQITPWLMKVANIRVRSLSSSSQLSSSQKSKVKQWELD